MNFYIHIQKRHNTSNFGHSNVNILKSDIKNLRIITFKPLIITISAQRRYMWYSLSDNEIPDAMVMEIASKSEIKENFTRRLYEEEGDLNTFIFEKANGERTMYIFDKQVKYEDESGNIIDKDASFRKITEKCQSEFSGKYYDSPTYYIKCRIKSAS